MDITVKTFPARAKSGLSLVSATIGSVDFDTLRVSWNKPLTGTASTSDFALTGNTITAVSFTENDNYVDLTLGTTATQSDDYTGDLSYTGTGLSSSDGTQVATFSGEDVILFEEQEVFGDDFNRANEDLAASANWVVGYEEKIGLGETSVARVDADALLFEGKIDARAAVGPNPATVPYLDRSQGGVYVECKIGALAFNGDEVTADLSLIDENGVQTADTTGSFDNVNYSGYTLWLDQRDRDFERRVLLIRVDGGATAATLAGAVPYTMQDGDIARLIVYDTGEVVATITRGGSDLITLSGFDETYFSLIPLIYNRTKDVSAFVRYDDFSFGKQNYTLLAMPAPTLTGGVEGVTLTLGPATTGRGDPVTAYEWEVTTATDTGFASPVASGAQAPSDVAVPVDVSLSAGEYIARQQPRNSSMTPEWSPASDVGIVSAVGTIALSTFGGDIYFTVEDTGGQTGTYANGSPWSTERVISTFPAETTGDITLQDASVLANQFLHGAQVDSGLTSSLQPYHGPTVTTPAALSNLAFGLDQQAIYPVGTGVSLVKAKTKTEDVRTDLRPALELLSPITIVDTVPPAGSIRPGLSASDKTPQLNEADIDLSILRDLDPAANDVPAMTYEQAIAKSVWRDTLQDTSNINMRNIIPDNKLSSAGPFYGGIGEDNAEVMLALHTNAFTSEQKITIINRLAEISIDYVARRRAGGIIEPNGGNSTGKVDLISFVAELFDSSYMRDVVLDVAAETIPDVVTEGYSVWGHINQIFKYEAYMIADKADLPVGERIPEEVLGYPIWDPDHGGGKPGGVVYNRVLGWNQGVGTSYLFTVSGHYIGGSLALRLMQGVTPLMPQVVHDWADLIAEYLKDGSYVPSYAPMFVDETNRPPAFITDYYQAFKHLVPTWTPPQLSPVTISAPTVSNQATPDSLVTYTLGSYAGTFPISTSYVLTLDGTDVTADMSGLDYTLPSDSAGKSLVFTETASGVAPDNVETITQTVTGPPLTITDTGQETESDNGWPDGYTESLTALNLQEDDYIIAVHSLTDQTSINGNANFTAPTGDAYTKQGREIPSNLGGAWVLERTGFKQVGATPDTTVDFTQGDNLGRPYASIVRGYRNVASISSFNANGETLTAAPPSVTSTLNGSIAVVIITATNSDGIAALDSPGTYGSNNVNLSVTAVWGLGVVMAEFSLTTGVQFTPPTLALNSSATDYGWSATTILLEPVTA